MFITTLFMVAKVQKQPNVHQQMGSRKYGVYIPWATREAMIYIYIYIHILPTIEYYSAWQKEEALSFATTG